ncbi:hypothetical protein BGX23_001743 [Mortierella sp. AD031]|nr:hypothetical protein BGX23_001743 [Mortierella sp. AD031]KAG0202775.1 hypothetical protein BGX33_009478 [Mortierella sp. NVP41]
MYFSTRTARLKTRLGISAILALLASTVTVQAQQQPGEKLCSQQLCVSATVFSKESTTIEFSLSAQIDSVGWVGVGVGGNAGGMAGNDLAICWPNPAGAGAIISQRSATKNGPPNVPAAPVAFKVQESKSGLQATRFTCTFSRPLNLTTSPIAETATSVRVIYAVGLRPVVAGAGNDPQKAQLQAHTFTGSGTVTILRKEGTSAGGTGNGNGTATPTQSGGTGTVPGPGATHTPGGGQTGTSSNAEDLLRAQEQIDTLVKVHAVMMALAFLLILPLGAFLVRFFCHLQHVFRWHRPIQGTGVVVVMTALGCIVASVYKSSSLNNDASDEYSAHAIVGFVLVGAILLQVIVGIFIFTKYDPSRTRQAAVVRIPTWVHRCWGYAVLITGLVQVYLGMKLYGMWPTGKEVIWYLYYAWVAVLVVGVFGLGSFLKYIADRRKDRRRGVEGDRPLKSSAVSDGHLGHDGDRYDEQQGPYELQAHGPNVSHNNNYDRL